MKQSKLWLQLEFRHETNFFGLSIKNFFDLNQNHTFTDFVGGQRSNITSKFTCSLKSIKRNKRLKSNSSNLATSIFSRKVSYESSFPGETNLSILIGDINSYHGRKRLNKLSCFNTCRVFWYIMPIIIFSAAVKTGLFGVNGRYLAS